MPVYRKPGAFAAIRNSDRLRDDVDLFITRIRDGAPEDQIPLLVRIMEGFLRECLDGLLGQGAEAVKVQGASRTVVEITVATVEKTCLLLSRQVLRKMRNEDVRALAEHMDALRLSVVDAEGRRRSYTVVPLGPALHRDIRQVHALVRDEPPSRHTGAIRDVLYQLMDVCIEHLYTRTLSTLRLGPIARKLVEMSYATVSSGARTMINRVLPHLSGEQLRAVAAFCHGLVLVVEENGEDVTLPCGMRGSTAPGVRPA